MPVERDESTPKAKANNTGDGTLERGNEPKGIHLQDLEQYDRTEVYGKDPNKHYRWCDERTIGLRRRQGYELTDDPSLDITAPGGSTHWKPEGRQAKDGAAGLVLMETTKENFEARQKKKWELNKERTEGLDDRVRRDIAKGGGKDKAYALDQSDDFIRRLKGAP